LSGCEPKRDEVSGRERESSLMTSFIICSPH